MIEEQIRMSAMEQYLKDDKIREVFLNASNMSQLLMIILFVQDYCILNQINYDYEEYLKDVKLVVKDLKIDDINYLIDALVDYKKFALILQDIKNNYFN